jgi:CheY-like chemotaxis protein
VPGVKVLVVDDEQSILDLVTSYLRREGYEVHTAMDGPAGLQAARALQPDLIVLGVALPGMDGIELLTGCAAFVAAQAPKTCPSWPSVTFARTPVAARSGSTASRWCSAPTRLVWCPKAT